MILKLKNFVLSCKNVRVRFASTTPSSSISRVSNAALKLPPGAVAVQPLSAVQKPKGPLKEEPLSL